MQQFDKKNIFLLESPKPTLFQNISNSQKHNSASNPFQSSKELFYKTPNRQRIGSPASNVPDISGLVNQKMNYLSNCIKNFVLSATKIQKILSQKADDAETVFALKLFEEDKRQIERLLRRTEMTKTGDLELAYFPDNEKSRTDVHFYPQDKPLAFDPSKIGLLSPEIKNQREKMQYYETIERMAKEKSKLRSTTQGHFFHQNVGQPRVSEYESFGAPKAELNSLQLENFELKKKIQELISEKAQMVLQASASGTSFHLGKTAITTNNTFFNEFSQANLLRDLKKMEAKAEDRKKEIKRLFSLLKDREAEIDEFRKTNKMSISETLKGELNQVIQEFEGNLEKKYHDLEEELVNKQLKIDQLTLFIRENNLEKEKGPNPEHENDKNSNLKDLDEKIAKIQERLKKKEGLSQQKRQEYEEMLRFLFNERREFLSKTSDFFLRTHFDSARRTQPIEFSHLQRTESKDSRQSLQEPTKMKVDFASQVDLPATQVLGVKEVEILKLRLAEAVKSKDQAIRSLDAANKSLDAANKSLDAANKSRDEAIKKYEEVVKASQGIVQAREDVIKSKEELQNEIGRLSERMKNMERNYQDRIKQLNKDGNNIQERYQMVVKDLEAQVIEKNREIEEMSRKIGGSLTSQNDKSLILKELENLTGKILDDFSSIFKLLGINQQEFQHLDIECCFELLGKLLIQLLKEKNDLLENNKILKTRLQQQERSPQYQAANFEERLKKELEASAKKHQEELSNLKSTFSREKTDLVKIYEEEKSRLREQIASFDREIKDFFFSQELPEADFHNKDATSLLKLLLESYKNEVEKFQTVSQDYHREYEAKIMEFESKRLLSQEDSKLESFEAEKARNEMNQKIAALEENYKRELAALEENHKRELEALAAEKDNEKDEYINVLNEAMKDLYMQIQLLNSEKKQIENDNLKLKMKLSSEIQSKEEIQGKATKKDVEFSQKFSEVQNQNGKLVAENAALKTSNLELAAKVSKMNGDLIEMKKNYESSSLKNGAELTMYKDKLISLSNEIYDLQQNNSFLANEFKIKLAEQKKNKEKIEELERTLKEKENALQELTDKVSNEEKLNHDLTECVSDLQRKIEENLDSERRSRELLCKLKEKEGMIADFERKLQDSQNAVTERNNRIRDLETKSLVLAQGTVEKEEELRKFLLEVEQSKTREIERINAEKELLSRKMAEKSKDFEAEVVKKQEEIKRLVEEAERFQKEKRKMVNDLEELTKRISLEKEQTAVRIKEANDLKGELLRTCEENEKNQIVIQEKARLMKVLEDKLRDAEKNARISEQRCQMIERNLQVSEEKTDESRRLLIEKEKSLRIFEERLKDLESSLRGSESKAKETEFVLKSYEEKARQLERSLQGTQSQLQDERRINEAISSEKAILQGKNQGLLSELESKTQQISSLSKEKDQQAFELDSRAVLIKELNGELTKAAKDKEKYMMEIETKATKIKELQEKSANDAKEKKQQASELDSKTNIIKDLNERIAKETRENRELLGKYQEILSQKTVYELHLANQKEAIQEFEVAKSSNIQNISDLKEVLTSKDYELEELRTQTAMLHETMKAKEAEASKMQVRLNQAEKELVEFKAIAEKFGEAKTYSAFISENLKSREAEIEKLEQTLKGKDKLLEDSKAEIKEINAKALVFSETLSSKEAELKKLESSLKSKEKTLEDALKDLKRTEEMNSKLKDQLLQNQEALFNLEQAKKGLEKLELEKEAVLKDLESALEQLEQKNAAILALQEENEDLAQQFQFAEKNLRKNSEDKKRIIKEKEHLLMDFSEKAVMDKEIFNQEIAQLQQEKQSLLMEMEEMENEAKLLAQENENLRSENREMREKFEEKQEKEAISENEKAESPKEVINFENFNMFPDQNSALPENSMNEDPILLRAQITSLVENNQKLANENNALREKVAVLEKQLEEASNEREEENEKIERIEKVKMTGAGQSSNEEETGRLLNENEELRKKIATMVRAEQENQERLKHEIDDLSQRYGQLKSENEDLKDKLENLKEIENKPKPLEEDMFENMESVHEKSSFMKEENEELIMVLQHDLTNVKQENTDLKSKLAEYERRILEKRTSKAGFDEQMLDYLEDQEKEKSNVNNDQSELDYRLYEETAKNLKAELEQLQRESSMKIKSLELKVEEKDLEILKAIKNAEELNEIKGELEKQIEGNKPLIEKLSQMEKMENEHVLLKMKIENLTIKVSSLEKELQNVERKLRLELEELLGETLAKSLDINGVFNEGFSRLQTLKAHFEEEYRALKKENQEENLKRQEKLVALSEENQRLEKANENLIKDFQKKLGKREAESKQMILMSNVFEKLFNEMLKHSDEIYKENIIELFELEPKNKEHVDRIIEKIDNFLKKTKEKNDYYVTRLQQLEENLAFLTNKSKQLEVQYAEKENKLQEINQKLESMSHQNNNNKKDSFSSIEADFSQLFASPGNDLMENSSFSLKNEIGGFEGLKKNEVNKLIKLENEMDELKSLYEQQKQKSEQLYSEIKERESDEQKIVNQMNLYKQELRNLQEKYKLLESANVIEGAKSLLIKFIENLALKKNSEVETHLSILMNFLEIKDPDKTLYMEMLFPKEKKRSSSLFKK